MWKMFQIKAGAAPVQLILDMKVRLSTYLILDHAEQKQEVQQNALIFTMLSCSVLTILSMNSTGKKQILPAETRSMN
jgi:hypothetical protein